MTTKTLPIAALLTIALPHVSCDTGAGGGGPVITDPNPANENKNGSRIQLRYAVTDLEDGSHFVNPLPTYYDTKLGTTCSVRLADDGKLRCLPVGDNWVYPSSSFFQDASCATPVGYTTNSGCIPAPDAKFVVASIRLTCVNSFKFSAAGATVSRSDLYVGDKGPCRKATSADFNIGMDGYTFFVIGAKLDAAEFVALKQ